MSAVATVRLQELESVVARGLNTFVEVGAALMEIRDSRLYKEDYGNFEEYCRERWGWSRVQADRTIAAAKITQLLPPIGGKPATESVARELTPLAREPEAVVEVWERVTEEHGERPTAKQVRETVRRISPPATRGRTPEPEIGTADNVLLGLADSVELIYGQRRQFTDVRSATLRRLRSAGVQFARIIETCEEAVNK